MRDKAHPYLSPHSGATAEALSIRPGNSTMFGSLAS